MALFHNRPLAAGCLVLILCVPLSFFLSGISFYLVPILALCLLIGCIFLRRRAPYAALCLALIFLAVALGFGRVMLDRAQHREIDNAVGSEKELTLRIEEITYEGSYRSEYTVKLIGTSGLAVLRADGELQPTPGSVIRGRFRVESRAYESYYEGQGNAYLAEGIRAVLIPVEVESVTPGSPSARVALGNLRTRIANRLREAMGAGAGNLAAAILLGDKTGLDDTVVRDFRRTGVSHLLAISGLHLAILAGFLDCLLCRLLIGKRLRVCLTMAFCVFYCLFTGASPSTIRAVLMLCILCFAFLCRNDADPVTSLFFAGAVIAMLTPHAVFGVSYQMTMLATLGILAYSHIRQQLVAVIPAGKGIAGLASRLLRVLLSSLCVTFCATLAVLPVQWVTFGEMSPISFVANLFLLPLLPSLLVFSLLALVFSAFSPLCLPFSFTAGLISDIIQGITARLSVSTTPISLQYPFVPFILLPMFLLLAFLLIVDLKKFAPLSLSPVPVAIAAFFICFAVCGNFSDKRVDVVYYQRGSNEGFSLFGGTKSLICDISNGSETVWNGEYAELLQLGATEVQVLMLTRYQSAQPYSLSDFSGQVLVRNVWVPEPKDDNERQILFNLCEVAAKRNIALTVFGRNQPLTVFHNGKITVSTSVYENRSVKPAYRVRFDFPEKSLLYCSAAYPEYAAHREKTLENGADILLLGTAGPTMKETVPVPSGFSLVVLTDESQLEHLILSKDCRYLYLPEKFRITMKQQ